MFDLGNQLKAARKARGMTLKQLAEKSGVHWVTLSRFENGSMDLGARKLTRVAQALGAEITFKPTSQGYTLDDLAKGLLREDDVPRNRETETAPVLQRVRRVRR